MKPTRWACYSWVLAALMLALPLAAWSAQLLDTSVLISASETPPPANAAWERVQLPASSQAAAAWYAIDFMADATSNESWSVYLPYMYGGARLFLNEEQLTQVTEGSPELVVRWERPHLVQIPPRLLRSGKNRLTVRVAATPLVNVRMPEVNVGPTVKLIVNYERRLFWTRTMSQFTVLACLVVGTLSVWIWWRRREEVLYGLFGIAAILWGVRTLTFVVEVLPVKAWQVWRTLYFGSTGGFVVLMLLFAMELCGIRAGRLKWLLACYWALGPLGYLLTGGNELLIARFWVAGLLPMGAAVVALTVRAALRRPSTPVLVLASGLALAVIAGVHDYLLAAAPAALQWLAPGLAGGRVFLLHYAADVLLIAMGCVLAARLVTTLHQFEQLNRTLESRVAASERTLALNYDRMVQLERQQAASVERQEIMRDLHDGLGSDLSVALTRAEAGNMGTGEIVQALRECMADMRLTLDVMSPEHSDFVQAWASFRFRWQQLLEGAGISPSWDLDTGGEELLVQPHVAVQLLRIVQEALTNVVKHARAKRVTVTLQTRAGHLLLTVIDDGGGVAAAIKSTGHGLANMRARAAKLGARLQIAQGEPGVRVLLSLPLPPAGLPQTRDGTHSPARAVFPLGRSAQV
jgi:signal transduction histidine kinase